MARRRTRDYRNAIRPGWVANSIIAGLIIAGIGMSYAWLGWKKKERAEQIRATRSAIEQLTRQRQALQVRMNESLDAPKLRARVDSMAPGLTSIGKDEGRLFKVPADFRTACSDK